MIPNNPLLKWNLCTFEELTNRELYGILRLRSEVFVVEQNCAYLDLDDKDYFAKHLTCFLHHESVAYCRILAPGISYADAASIGRVVNAKSVRGWGIGRELMQRALQQCELDFPDAQIRISAQNYLKQFYESLGFRPASETYIEDNILHLEMLWEKKPFPRQ